MCTDFYTDTGKFTFYPEDLLHHRLRDSGHGYKSLWYSHRCGQDVPVWCGWCSLILAGELQKNAERVAAGVFIDASFNLLREFFVNFLYEILIRK